jgi:hypothetical protein
MPQSPLQANVALNAANKSAPLQMDASGNLLTGNGSANKLNVTAATVIKATAGRICKITVNTVTSTSLVVSDVATTGAVAAANLVLSVAAAQLTAGQIINLDFPCTTGIVVNPGTGGVVSVSFD